MYSPVFAHYFKTMADKSQHGDFPDKKERFKTIITDEILRKLYLKKQELQPLIIEMCNGHNSWAFSDAYIDYSKQKESFIFEVWFQSFYKDIIKTLEGDKKVADEYKSTVESLLDAVVLGQHLKCLQTLLKGKPCESKVAAMLALHYFKPLVHGCSYILDKNTEKKYASCELCQEKFRYDDTSFGNKKVWHGHADVVLHNSVVTVTCDLEEDLEDLSVHETYEKEEIGEKENFECDDMLGESCGNVPINSVSETEIESVRSMTRKTVLKAISQAIVNAFCEAKKDPSLFKTFVPSFMATEKHVWIILYNCELDMLLMSEKCPIWEENSEELDVSTILKVWLALNYSYKIENELPDYLLKNTLKSRFKEIVGKAYSVYKTEVERPLPQGENDTVDDCGYCGDKFDFDTRVLARKSWNEILDLVDNMAKHE